MRIAYESHSVWQSDHQCTFTYNAYKRVSRLWVLKKIGLLAAADVTKVTREGSEKMAYKFDEHDAMDLSRMIRRRRPGWNHNGIMGQLQQAAERGASLGQVTSAAERTWNNPKAKTPAALMWSEHWEVDKKERSISGERLCAYCEPPRKHPIEQMMNQTGTWMCISCSERH